MCQNDSNGMIVTPASDVELPTAAGRFRCIHLRSVSTEGVILVPIGSNCLGETPLLRIQSSCLFSESLHATDCDCAAQLDESLLRIAKRGGALVYLYEEGRGAGLGNKMRAIHLQQAEGLSTTEAYKRLALRPDNRTDYRFVRKALDEFVPRSEWILLTNSPLKESLTRNAGIRVLRTEPLICGIDNPEVADYLAGKAAQFGHRIE